MGVLATLCQTTCSSAAASSHSCGCMVDRSDGVNCSYKVCNPKMEKKSAPTSPAREYIGGATRRPTEPSAGTTRTGSAPPSRQAIAGKMFKKCKSATFQIDGATYTIGTCMLVTPLGESHWHVGHPSGSMATIQNIYFVNASSSFFLKFVVHRNQI